VTEFKEIYDLYETQVYRYLLTLCRDENIAEELTQETFYRAYMNIKNFQGKCSLYTWLCQIARNILINYRKNKSNQTQELSLDNCIGVESIEKFLIEKEQALQIHKALHQLNEPYKEVFALRIFGELSYREIADVFGKTENWAKVTCYRAKGQLIKEMEENQ
jgi:RNA polymerase sigma-70 factor (ECF subfamily)